MVLSKLENLLVFLKLDVHLTLQMKSKKKRNKKLAF